jgi:hypothetical protein
VKGEKMSRGKFYTSEEDEKLMSICEDMKNDLGEKIKLVDIAERAQRYGICSERNKDALAQHISVLMTPKPPKKDDEEDEDEKTLYDYTIEKELQEYKSKYEDLLRVLFDKASLNDSKTGLFWNWNALTYYLRTTEPTKYMAKMEELFMNE